MCVYLNIYANNTSGLTVLKQKRSVPFSCCGIGPCSSMLVVKSLLGLQQQQVGQEYFYKNNSVSLIMILPLLLFVMFLHQVATSSFLSRAVSKSVLIVGAGKIY